jgi:peptide/nickel transport system substrate-binding protein
MNLPEEVVLFFRTSQGPLADKTVRQGLAAAINRQTLIRDGLGGHGTSLGLPILPDQVGFSARYRPAAFDKAEAEKLLDDAGWRRAEGEKVRSKDGKPLVLKLATARTGDYPRVATVLQQQLAEVGVKLEITMVEVAALQQSYIRPRNYDALLYGINIGADPDVYVYWHSSQISDPGLNLSQFKSTAADKALEGARLTTENSVRTARYSNFLSAWTAEVPAVVLYQPEYMYVTNPSVQGIVAKKLVDPSDRFYGVEDWTVKTRDIERY